MLCSINFLVGGMVEEIETAVKYMATSYLTVDEELLM
jgi:hypothetical protein